MRAPFYRDCTKDAIIVGHRSAATVSELVRYPAQNHALNTH